MRLTEFWYKFAASSMDEAFEVAICMLRIGKVGSPFSVDGFIVAKFALLSFPKFA